MPSTKSAAKPKAKLNLAFEAIGTQWLLDLQAPESQAQKLSKLVTDRIVAFDKNYSRFRDDSWVNQVRTPGSYSVPPDFAPLFRFYEQLHKVTDGTVTPLIGDAMERAGYDSNYSLNPKALLAIPNLMQSHRLKGNTLHVKYKSLLDFGAAGKGYLVDLIAELLLAEGVEQFIIDAGGDIRNHSPAPTISTPVALESPLDTTEAIGSVNLGNGSICGSAPNRRRWGQWHHIIDPHKLKSTTTILATWVITNDDLSYPTMTADGLATALFFVEPAQLQQFAFEYVLVKEDNTFSVSTTLNGTLFA